MSSTAPARTSEGTVDLLASSLADGKDWPTALVEAMAVWPSPREVHRGRERNYFIAGEAFDWLTLAERLLDTIRKQVPEGREGRAPVPRPVPAAFRQWTGSRP